MTEALYAEHHQSLIRIVRHVVSTSDANVEDACQFAWLQLLRTKPRDDGQIFAWLKTVAIREAIRLDRGDRRPTPLDESLAERLADPATAGPDLALETDEALEAVRSLPLRQRRLLGLKVAGFSYDEIGELTGDTWRTVDRQLVRARATLRDLR